MVRVASTAAWTLVAHLGAATLARPANVGDFATVAGPRDPLLGGLAAAARTIRSTRRRLPTA